MPSTANDLQGRRDQRPGASRRGLTLVEMLVSMAITLVMMAAVVTLFANVSDSITRRRATVEMNSQVRAVRAVLQNDLAGATCPAQPWQKPESNHGYLELIEGAATDVNPSPWLNDADNDGAPDGPDGVLSTDGEDLDLATSTLPGSTLRALPNGATVAADAKTDGRGLGDADDVLMLTVRNESEPFTGRVPAGYRQNDGDPNDFPDWGSDSMQSTLAEVVWFAVENPAEKGDQRTFSFGEAGYRTIYRRALLIAPWLDYRFRVNAAADRFTGPGVVRVLPASVAADEVDQALAALVAFQDRYDLSVRLEWDATLGVAGRWTLVANSLADLTKRENRYEHHGYWFTSGTPTRRFPFAAFSAGGGLPNGAQVELVLDPEYAAVATPARFVTATLNAAANQPIAAYRPDPALSPVDASVSPYPVRPFAYIDEPLGGTDVAATSRAVLNEGGQVVHVTAGLAPLGGSRRGEDLMLSDALAFDVRAFDPGAPVYAFDSDADFTNANSPEEQVQPGDAGWNVAYATDILQDGGSLNAPDAVGDLPGASPTEAVWRVATQGAYTDLGYGFAVAGTRVFAGFAVPGAVTPQFFQPRGLHSNLGGLFSPGYSSYDTWSRHYENNGLDEDLDGAVDEGANGFDDPGVYGVWPYGMAGQPARDGVDDDGERETRPPYDVALRGVQVTLRAYEFDSRQIREVKVKQTFVPK